MYESNGKTHTTVEYVFCYLQIIYYYPKLIYEDFSTYFTSDIASSLF